MSRRLSVAARLKPVPRIHSNLLDVLHTAAASLLVGDVPLSLQVCSVADAAAGCCCRRTLAW